MHRLLCAIALVLGMVTAPTVTNAQNYESLFREFSAAGLSQSDKRFLQAALAFEGVYYGLLDGSWGKLSQTAMERYSQRELGTSAEDWHLAVLAFAFVEKIERDGWAIKHFDGLNMSMLYPYRAILNDPNSDNFVNWRHANSSVSFSVGIHDVATAQRLHSYTESTHNSPDEPYILRRKNLAITRATQSDGGALYTRSNFINGAWSTVMLAADRRDIPILTAIASSLGVGYVKPLRFSEGGKLSQVISKVVAFAAEEEKESSANQNASPEPQATDAQKSSGTGFVVSSKGHILTNAHVVEGCTALKVDGEAAETIAIATDFDLALLRVEPSDEGAIASFSPTPAKLNSDVTVIGYPLAGILSGLNVTRGAVSSQMGLGGNMSGMQITAPVQPGNSGGPVLAADGEVVGVVVSKLNAQVIADATGDIPQNVNFAIRGEIAKLFMFQHGVEPVLGTSDAPLSPVDLAQLAAEFTKFIECN